jgi:hypothetical protein
MALSTDPTSILSNGHWQLEDFNQRMTTKEWRQILLDERDTIIVKGQCRKLVAKSLGYGVVNIRKEPRWQLGN